MIRIISFLLALLIFPTISLGAMPTYEVCANELDDDSTDGDAQCAGDDGDHDGYPSDIDCDDTNRRIYPGVVTSCGDNLDWTICNPTYAPATLTYGSSDSELSFSSKTSGGSDGNDVTITFVDPGTTTTATTAVTTGKDIVVTLSYSGSITATANDVRKAILVDRDSSLLVKVTTGRGTGDGTSVVTTLAQTSLTGGVAGDNQYGTCNDATTSSGFYTGTGSGTAYYISTTGSDAADGLSPATAWLTGDNVKSGGGVGSLASGDTLFLMAGVHTWTVYSHGSKDSMFQVRIVDGTEAQPIVIRGYPGAAAIVDPGCDNGTPCHGLVTQSSDYVNITDLEIRGWYGSGIFTEDSGKGVFQRNVIHCDGDVGVDCYMNHNEGAIQLVRHSKATIDHNTKYYDVPSGSISDNSAIGAYFETSAYIEYDNDYWLTASIGHCEKEKHARGVSGDLSQFIVWENNYTQNCAYGHFASGSVAHVRYNLSIETDDSTGLFYRGINLGGACSQGKTKIGPKITYNTASNINRTVLLDWDGDVTSDGCFKDTSVIEYNVFDNFTASDALATARYATNVQAATFYDAGKLTMDNNCIYDSTGDVSWCHSCGSESYGDTEDGLAAWQAVLDTTGAALPYSANSVEGDPVLAAETLAATAVGCTARGHTLGYVSNFISAPEPTVYSKITYDSTPMISGALGTNEVGATVSVTVDSVVYTATAYPVSGLWELADNTILEENALASGTYNVAVTVTDVNGAGSDATSDEIIIRDKSIVGRIGDFIQRFTKW